MKSNSVIFFTENPDANQSLITLFESISTVSVCSYNSQTWDDIDLYAKNIVAFVFDGLRDNSKFPWIVTKLSEDGVFNDVPVIFTSDESMYAFEGMGLRACAIDLINGNIRQDVFVRRFENLVEIFHLKRQMNKMSSIHTKRILDQANMLKEQSNKMNTMNFELVELLVAAIESRDMESGQHIKRIKYFTKALTDVVVKECPEYNISAIQAEYIFLASSVHDIGKIAIPDAIMLKPGRLTREEYEIMKTHTTHGAQLLDMLEEIGDSQYSRYCRDICLYHHERWDGKGYPKGLKGDEIPISAQIVSIADCYDALTSDRPYKNALSHEEAVELIMNGACGAFSEQLLECFRIALPEFSKIERKFKESASNDSSKKVEAFPAKSMEYQTEYQLYSEHNSADSDAERNLKISICEDKLLSAYNVIFEADILQNDFQVIRGSWSPLFPFLPKNIYEAFAQCHKICHPADSARFLQNVSMSAFKELVKSGIMKTRVEFRAVKKDVEYVILGIIAFEADENKEITKVFGAFDAYFEDEIEKEIQRSFTVSDGLTGIPLQKKFSKDVDDFIKVMPNSKNVLIFIDIDEMNMINSMFGYEYGNSFIKEIAAKLREFKETNDIYIGKSSADKFLVFVKNVSKLRELIMLIDSLHKNLRRTYHTSNEIGIFTVTMGVAKYPEDGKCFKELFNNAEFASKAAKLNKRSTYAFYNPSMKDFSQLSNEISEIEGVMSSGKIQNFFPVVSRKTNELVCYDYNPFAGSLNKIAFTSDLYHAVNKTDTNVKNFSLLAIKNLLLMLLEKRDEGLKIPPISIYTLLVPDDIPGFIQNLNDFVKENDCSGIKLTVNVPQDFLENIEIRHLVSFSSFLTSIGFSLGVYLVGERYIHNNCYSRSVFERIVLAPTFLDTALMSKNASNYAALTLNNLKKVSEFVSIPLTVSECDADILFANNCSDFTHTLAPLSSLDEMFSDFENRSLKQDEEAIEKVFISDLNTEKFIHNFLNSSIVLVSYDAKEDKIELSENASDVFGFDYKNSFKDSSLDFVKTFVSSEDYENFMYAVSSAKETLKPVVCSVKCVADSSFNKYKQYTVSIQCVLNHSGQPSRFQCILIPME
ncbi:MAG: diguanylate cyclase [Clostridia bacterium]|nr:diguanylate cyclase [Clostridia bacterium]